MALDQKTAYLTRLRIGRGATPTWTTVTDFESLKMPSVTREDIKTTKIDSAGGVHTYIPSPFKEMGEIGWTMTFEPDSALDELFTELQAAAQEFVQVEVTFPDSTTPRVFACYLKSYEIQTLEAESEMKADVVFKVSGNVGP